MSATRSVAYNQATMERTQTVRKNDKANKRGKNVIKKRCSRCDKSPQYPHNQEDEEHCTQVKISETQKEL